MSDGTNPFLAPEGEEAGDWGRLLRAKSWKAKLEQLEAALPGAEAALGDLAKPAESTERLQLDARGFPVRDFRLGGSDRASLGTSGRVKLVATGIQVPSDFDITSLPIGSRVMRLDVAIMAIYLATIKAQIVSPAKLVRQKFAEWETKAGTWTLGKAGAKLAKAAVAKVFGWLATALNVWGGQDRAKAKQEGIRNAFKSTYEQLAGLGLFPARGGKRSNQWVMTRRRGNEQTPPPDAPLPPVVSKGPGTRVVKLGVGAKHAPRK